MSRRLPAGLRRALARRTLGPVSGAVIGPVTFTEATGQVCTAACRAAARIDHARTRALAAGPGRPW